MRIVIREFGDARMVRQSCLSLAFGNNSSEAGVVRGIGSVFGAVCPTRFGFAVQLIHHRLRFSCRDMFVFLMERKVNVSPG